MWKLYSNTIKNELECPQLEELHQILHLVSLTIWNDTILKLLIVYIYANKD